ncbi:hypothetical protein GN958_ATG22467 [Phytophthora infestans]|uniref:Uncharacterized protein n=1 Tax=Phytophthora infestans TaxID=4787 RepID=A0A8S9TNV2_PHYIN|nr:hypothetical protein GN958_ATG22467 [Phytophthora infestans]
MATKRGKPTGKEGIQSLGGMGRDSTAEGKRGPDWQVVDHTRGRINEAAPEYILYTVLRLAELAKDRRCQRCWDEHAHDDDETDRISWRAGWKNEVPPEMLEKYQGIVSH